MTQKKDTRDAILEAASERILHYGYAKTTMSEIARDCDMSAGNIYRFFPSKLDIAEAMARKFLAEIAQQYAAIVRDAALTPLERLRMLFLNDLRRTSAYLDRGAKILDVARVLRDERPNFQTEEMNQVRVQIAQVLIDGVKVGDFEPQDDPNFTALMLQHAMTRFSSPDLIQKTPIEQLEKEFEGVFSLICRGLCPKDVTVNPG